MFRPAASRRCSPRRSASWLAGGARLSCSAAWSAAGRAGSRCRTANAPRGRRRSPRTSNRSSSTARRRSSSPAYAASTPRACARSCAAKKRRSSARWKRCPARPLSACPGRTASGCACGTSRIVGFGTHFTGEAFAVLKAHSLLGRMLEDGAPDEAAFLAGVARSAEPEGLLHHLFGVRAKALFDELLRRGRRRVPLRPADRPRAAQRACRGRGVPVFLLGARRPRRPLRARAARARSRAAVLDAESAVNGMRLLARARGAR